MTSLETRELRASLDDRGQVVRLSAAGPERECLAPGEPAPLLMVTVGGRELAPTGAAWDPARGMVRLAYDAEVRATVKAEAKPTHLTFELVEVEGATPTRVHWGPFPTTIGATVGQTVGVARDREFALGIQSLNVQTVGGASPKEHGSALWAYAIEHDGGVRGSKIALFGCPAARALETIGEIEVTEGLPHPMLDGEWGKVSATARLSYLIVPFSEADIDEVLAFAQEGGFRYIYHPGPFRTWGHFQLSPDQFPGGDAGLRQCVEAAAKVGIRVGLHTLTGFITTNDSYVTPAPDPRLARMGSATLTAAIDESATEIPVADPQPFRDRQVLATAILGEELVQYGGVSEEGPWRLTGCTRGAFGTRPSAHGAGTDIGKLADHGYRTFYPGIENGMMDEMTGRLVELLNTCGLRQMSFDGLEGLSTYGYGEYARNRFVKQCWDGWQGVREGPPDPVSHQGEVITDASNLLHYPWHIHTRMNWGELTQSAKVDVDVYRADNCRYFEENLFPKAMGWWRLGVAAPDWEATRLEDVEYLLAKCAGWDACHGLDSHPSQFRAHGYGQDCLRMVKGWDEARYRGAFNDGQRARLREKGRDWHLEETGEGRWRLTEVRCSPFLWLRPEGLGTEDGGPRANGERRVMSFTTASEEHPGSVCRVANPFGKQAVRFELRALGSFDYESAGNIDLMPRRAEDLRREPDLHGDAPEVRVSEAEVNGLRGCELSAAYAGRERPSWVTRVVADVPGPLNLLQHRGVGCWVRGDGKGELLFVELVARDAKRQYYVPVDFTGERYFEFPLGEMCLGRYYAYDWNHWSGFASWWVTLKGFDYGQVSKVTMGFNALPVAREGEQATEVRCAVAGLRALKEVGTGLSSPTVSLNGRALSFGGTLSPYSYLVYDGGPKAEVRDANYRLLRGVTPTGEALEVAPGENIVTVAYEGADGPPPWSRWEFRCVGPGEEVAKG